MSSVPAKVDAAYMRAVFGEIPQRGAALKELRRDLIEMLGRRTLRA